MQEKIIEAISQYVEMRNDTVHSHIDSAMYSLKSALIQSAKIDAALELQGRINRISQNDEQES